MILKKRNLQKKKNGKKTFVKAELVNTNNNLMSELVRDEVADSKAQYLHMLCIKTGIKDKTS